MNEVPVPVEVVQLTEETGATIAPSIGDVLTLTVEGEVTRVDAGQVWVKPKTINGQEIPEATMPPTAEAMDSEMAAMMEEEY